MKTKKKMELPRSLRADLHVVSTDHHGKYLCVQLQSPMGFRRSRTWKSVIMWYTDFVLF